MISTGDTAWVLISAALVMLMVPGLALFYGGLVRARSSLNTMMMSCVALGLVGVQWVLVGYSLAFQPGGRWLGGLQWLGLRGVGMTPEAAYGPTVPHLAFALFQAMFAVITVALISGAVVERMQFRGYLLFALLWSVLVYDPLAHWVWGAGGWIRAFGALDFAGGTVVHVSAGTSALVAALMIGPRREFGRVAFVPHNVPFTLLGAGLLWFGWFGFNAGSALAADGIAAAAFASTFAAGAAGLSTWVALDLKRSGRPTAVGAATGAVVGLVAVTPAAGFVTPLAGLVIGALGATASFFAIQARARLRVDDSLDVFACHGVAGILGALLTGVFASKAVNPAGADGLLAGNAHQVVVQLAAVAATMVFAGGMTAGCLRLIQALGALRLSASEEIAGADLQEHGEEAYYGEDVSALAGRRVPLGAAVVMPVAELKRASGSRPLELSAEGA